jgi:hypothetical protein
LLALPAGVIALQGRETSVYIQAPSVDLEVASDLPAGISPAWLVEQLKVTLRQRLGEIHVDGPIGATPDTVFYAGDDGMPPEHEERLALYLHCRDHLCAMAASREHAGRTRIEHASLLPGLSPAQLATIVRSTTSRLYD